MLRNIPIPPSSPSSRKEYHLLLNEEYKDLLLQQGIEDIETFVARYAGVKQLPEAGVCTLHSSQRGATDGPSALSSWRLLRAVTRTFML